MTIAEAQQEIRAAYLGGFAGQLVSGLLWLGSAALASWGPARWAILLLVAGGFFIFPATLLTLRLIGHRVRASRANPLNALAMQVAFVLPLSLPLVFAAALHKLNWFYPAFMIVLGAHYLPFTFLYGMRMFIALCGALVGAGVLVGLYGSDAFSPGAWITGGILLLFAAIGRIQVGKELASGPTSGES
ncbi:MAG TPA: hypothetical protein VGR67_07650 [Candidatus Polarisedimenticolia bacterium]|jgi:hypothetical protein|nr:hypothetical protein [Candidatus Polarisedimenticolia bacterium]